MFSSVAMQSDISCDIRSGRTETRRDSG